MPVLYNIGIQIMYLIILIRSFFSKKEREWLLVRKGWVKNLKSEIKNQNNIVWFHCASAGEFEQAIPLIKAYREKSPQHKILLTFFSISGFKMMETKKIDVDWTFNLPLDTESNAKLFLEITKPIKVFFIKYEFWFNYMKEIKERNIPIYFVSSLFRPNQLFFKNKWWGNQLKNVDHFFVQNQHSRELLLNLNINRVTVSGDTRFDRVYFRKKEERDLDKPIWLNNFLRKKQTIIAGSTWKKDEDILFEFIKSHSNFNFIIVPHDPERSLSVSKRFNAMLYSNEKRKEDRLSFQRNNMLVIDRLGLLFSLYKYASIAYIGGGFDKGIHNILEPACFGKPIIFGPNYKKFKEAYDLIELKGAESILDFSQLRDSIYRFQKFENKLTKDYMSNKCGATEKIIKEIVN
tara:strand:- start:162 stop:1376 length:1215 start_codon:yes stop_codon:yes gene_type:complete